MWISVADRQLGLCRDCLYQENKMQLNYELLTFLAIYTQFFFKFFWIGYRLVLLLAMMVVMMTIVVMAMFVFSMVMVFVLMLAMVMMVPMVMLAVVAEISSLGEIVMVTWMTSMIFLSGVA